ncbi:MAG: DMT family transporter [Bacillota bacterium]
MDVRLLISGLALLLYALIIHAFNTTVVLSAVFCILAALCYGMSIVFMKKYCSHISSLDISIGQLLGGGLLLLPIAMFSLPKELSSVAAAASLLILSVLCTSFALIVFFTFIRNLGPTKASTTLFLAHVFGMTWGSMFLDEIISISII